MLGKQTYSDDRSNAWFHGSLTQRAARQRARDLVHSQIYRVHGGYGRKVVILIHRRWVVFAVVIEVDLFDYAMCCR